MVLGVALDSGGIVGGGAGEEERGRERI